MPDYPILLEKHGHAGYGDPPDIRLPAQEFYRVGGPGEMYMAEGFNDGLPAKPRDPKMDLKKGPGAAAPITKNYPLHVDGVREQKRRELEYFRGINVPEGAKVGEGCSAATWMRGRGQAKVPMMSAGANYPPWTARGQKQNFYPGRTKPASAGAQAQARDRLYTGQGTSRKGHLVALAGATHGRGFVARVQPDEEPWPVEWPDHNNTDRPVVLRRPPHRAVDGAGNEVNRDQGLEAMFGVVHRRGNRVPARARGQAGLFSGEEGAWLRRMWRANAWAQRGGVRGVLASGQGDALHQPVADGFAPPRRGTDGWGAQKWPHEGGHFVNGNGGLSRRVEFSGGVRRTGQAHRPVELQPGCYRAGCPHPHGKDRADDLIHGLPVKGLSKTLMSGRVLAKGGPAKRQAWNPLRPQSAPRGWNHSPWAGYAAHNVYF